MNPLGAHGPGGERTGTLRLPSRRPRILRFDQGSAVEAEQIVDVVQRYAAALTANDADAAAALFAADAVVRDPIDAPPYEGVEAIRTFLAGGKGIVKAMTVDGPVRIVADGLRAAAPMQARLDFGDGPKTLDAVDVFTFGDDGLIVSMDAYYGPANFNPA